MQGKVTSEARAETAVYAGIDVCKAWLDVYLHPAGQLMRVANSQEGCKRLALELASVPVALIVMEATGKLHRLAHRLLSQAGFAVAVVNPYRSRKLADALGQLAKTDTIDARLLALYGAALEPEATPVAAAILAELQELVLARQAAKAAETALKNQHGAAESPVLKRLLKAQLEAQARLIEALQNAIAALLAKDAGLQRRYELLTSIKGIGPIVAATLIACLSELGLLAALRSQLLPASRPSIAIPARGAGNAASKAEGPMSEARSTWRPSRPSAAIQTSKPSMPACGRRERPQRSRSPPSCASSSFLPTRSSVKIVIGCLNMLDFKHRCSPRRGEGKKGSSDLAPRGDEQKDLS